MESRMPTFLIAPRLQAVPKVLRRGRDGVMVLARQGDTWVLAGKKDYPEGIAKLLGGGINAGEEPAAAAVRELREETGAVVSRERLRPLVMCAVQAMVAGEFYACKIYVYAARVGEPMLAADDVDTLVPVADDEVGALLRRFDELDGTVMPLETAATWADWAAVWGPVHREAFERVEALRL